MSTIRIPVYRQSTSRVSSTFDFEWSFEIYMSVLNIASEI